MQAIRVLGVGQKPVAGRGEHRLHPRDAKGLGGAAGLFVDPQGAGFKHGVVEILPDLGEGAHDVAGHRFQTKGAIFWWHAGLDGFSGDDDEGRHLGREGRVTFDPLFRHERGIQPLGDAIHRDHHHARGHQRHQAQKQRTKAQACL